MNNRLFDLMRGSAYGADTVPAMLTPGEVVLNQNQQRNVGNITGMPSRNLFQAAGVPGSPMGGASSGNTMEGGGMYIRDLGEQSGGGIDEGSGIHTWGDEQRTGDMGGMLGYKKGGKVKATGGYKVVGQRKGYKVGE